MTKDTHPAAAASYRLRMRYLQWNIDIYDEGGHVIQRRGPFLTMEDANAEAEATGLRDGDK